MRETCPRLPFPVLLLALLGGPLVAGPVVAVWDDSTAAEARPGAISLWIEAAQTAREPALKMALFDDLLRHLTAPEGPPRQADPAAILAVAATLLGEQLSRGLVEDAWQTFQSLPPEVRARLMEGAEGRVETKIDGLPFVREIRDLRIELAAAFLLNGQPAATLELLQRRDEQRSQEGYDPFGLLRRVVQAWMAPPLEDPFSLWTDLSSQWHRRQLPAASWLLVARLAERESYPAVASFFLRQAVGAVTAWHEPDTSSGAVPARLQQAVRGLEHELAALELALRSEIRVLDLAARAALLPDAAPDTGSQLLRASPRVRFQAHRLPSGMAPVDEPGDLPRERREALSHPLAAPPGFGIVRSEVEGDRAVAIGVAHENHPDGINEGLYYWVLLSSDGGKTWDPPLYTGLRKRAYGVRKLSALPLLRGNRLRVEVEVGESDTSEPTERGETGLFLEIPIGSLRQDSDGDGLTDLIEERLLLDPERSDTDGDGLSDGTDPLPGVPLASGTGSPRTRALAALLPKIWGPRPAGREETHFFVGDRSLFTGIRPDRRLVVLAREEAQSVTERFIDLELFFFDRSGRRAYAVWSAPVSGGQVLLTEKEGTWTAAVGSRWIY